MELKHQQDLEKLRMKQDQDVIDATNDSTIYNQDWVIKMLNNDQIEENNQS